MSSNEPISFAGETIAPGVLQEALRHALNVVRETELTDTPFLCWVCNRFSRNIGASGGWVCKSCQENNATIDPVEIVARTMGWKLGHPADLGHVLSDYTNKTVEELVHLIVNGELGIDELAILWDEATKTPTNAVRIERVEILESNRSANPSPRFMDKLVNVPEEEWIYTKRPRPLTPKEREAQKVEQETSFQVDKEKRAEAAKRAVIKQLEKSLKEARDSGIDVDKDVDWSEVL